MRALTALLALALHAALAHAAEADLPLFAFSGFGTLGIVRSSEDQADFTSSIFKPDGAGHDRAWSTAVDSVLAAQLTANPSRRLSAVLQVIAEQRWDGTFIPSIEWANVKYQFGADFFVRAGRVVMPSFLVSGYRKVGYANAWVRPPLEVYGLVPITRNDGIDTSLRVRSGDVVTTLQAFYGQLDSTFIGGGRIEARNQAGLVGTSEFGPLTVRAAYHQAHLSIEGAFFDAFRQLGPQGNAIADRYECAGKLIPFASLGASYDPGPWFLMGEWGSTDSHCVTGKRNAWYASSGYRFGKLTPYMTYSRSRARSLSDPGLDVASAAGLNAALNAILATQPVQQAHSAGARWDFMPDAAFTLQYDRIRIGAGSNGTFTNLQPGFRKGGKAGVFSVSFDFLF